MEELPDLVYYCVADLYGDDVCSDEDDFDEEELEELILDDLETQYQVRPDSIDVYINSEVGEDTEIEVYVDWPTETDK